MKLAETIYQILAEETYAEEYKSPVHREQVRTRMRVIADKIANQLEARVIVKFADVEEEIKMRMVGKIIKGNLDGQKVAEQWINVNNAILIAKQIIYKHYSKFSE
jgi:hypothetical protein